MFDLCPVFSSTRVVFPHILRKTALFKDARVESYSPTRVSRTLRPHDARLADIGYIVPI
ncbi:unnamed protein product [Periconia digitata]|uniref:Uncharacterized protein n=1 Tax=Periconia digitata TaxID=1303443 RepID=A0A9W4UR08_9PLEO|nr:unnamed protein product [Periconia digitata]